MEKISSDMLVGQNVNEHLLRLPKLSDGVFGRCLHGTRSEPKCRTGRIEHKTE